MATDPKSRWDVIYSFVGYGGVVGPACVIAYLKAESVIRGGLSELSPQSVLLTGASVLASIMLVLPMGFMLALPAAVSAGLIYSFTPVRWRRIWVAAIIGLVTAAALATGLQLTLGSVDQRLRSRALLRRVWRHTWTDSSSRTVVTPQLCRLA